MRRLPPWLLLLLASSAHAQAPRSVAVRATGVPSADRIALQAAIDACPAGGVVRVRGLDAPAGVARAGEFPVDRTVFLDRQGVGLHGVAGTTLAAYGWSGDVLSTVPRAPGSSRGPPVNPGVTLDPASLTPEPGVLDATAGKRLAWHTGASTHLVLLGTPLDRPADSWGASDRITVDLFYRDDDAAAGKAMVPEAGILCGFAGPAYAPFALYQMRDGSIRADYGCSDGKVRRAIFASPRDGKPHRIIVDIDLAGGSVRCAADRTWLKGTGDVAPPPGLKFARNESGPFCVGSNAASSNGVSDWYGGPFAMTVFGLKVSTLNAAGKATYAPGLPGSPVTRVDGTAIDDAHAYFGYRGPDPTVLYFPFDDDPNQLAADRTIRAIAPRFSGTPMGGPILDNAAHASPGKVAVGSLVVSDLAIRGGGWGRGIAAGFIIGCRFERVSVANTCQGFASAILGSNYDVTLRDCRLGPCNDAALYLNYSSGYTIDNLSISGSGRCPIRLELSGPIFTGRTYLDGKKIGPGEAMVTIRGGGATFASLAADNEGGDWPTGAAIDADTSSNRFEPGWGSLVEVGSLVLGNMPPGVPLYKLSGDLPGRLAARGHFYRGPGRPAVRLSGKGWAGSKLDLWNTPVSASGDVQADAGMDASQLTIAGRPVVAPNPPAPSLPR